jgi:hypothetical protein
MLQAVSHHLLCPLSSVVAVPLSGIRAYDLSGQANKDYASDLEATWIDTDF